MNTFEVIFYGMKKTMTITADRFAFDNDWITFYDTSDPSDVRIVAIFATLDVLCVIRKDNTDD